MYAALSSLENHTQFHTKMGEVFSDQKGPKPLLMIVGDRDKV